MFVDSYREQYLPGAVAAAVQVSKVSKAACEVRKLKLLCTKLLKVISD